MKRTIGTGWFIGIVAAVLCAIGVFFWFGGNRPTLGGTRPVQAHQGPLPMQKFVPRATEP